MRQFFGLVFLGLLGCDDHKFTGGHSSSVDVSGGGYDVVAEIISNSCLSCHSNSSASGGLSLEGDLCSATIGVVSPSYGETLVVPGDHQASVFWHKCAATNEYGQEMPIGSPLPAEQADAIAQWIDDGASCESGSNDTGETVALDADGDGYDSTEDCNDDDMSINPGAEEIWYDNIDQNCDGESDFDADGDGFESDDYAGSDCDDRSSDADEDGEADGFAINPDADEVWYDGIDQDCNGGSDYDQDGDGQDSDAYGGTDCDDANNTIYEGASEVAADGIDQDCDGSDLLQVEDSDGDGFDNTVDCDDSNNAVNPGASESTTPNGLDDNCDGDIDEDTVAFDDDGDCYCEDGYQGNCTGSAESSCGNVQVGDCNDASAVQYPGFSEGLYDGIDSDCDGFDYVFDLTDGETRFNANGMCAGCHTTGVDLATRVPTMSAQEIYNVIIDGIGYMPSQASKPELSDTQDRVNVAEYVWVTYQ